MSQNISNLRINFLCCSIKDTLLLVVVGKPGAHLCQSRKDPVDVALHTPYTPYSVDITSIMCKMLILQVAYIEFLL